MQKLSHFYRLLTALMILSLSSLASTQDFVWAPDFPVGTSIPAIEAVDQDGVVRTFDELKGEKGLLLMLSRSFDW
jgi:cytochrome oxidase Cu insertion factor (SCO1/SenC/PrrC family)